MKNLLNKSYSNLLQLYSIYLKKIFFANIFICDTKKSNRSKKHHLDIQIKLTSTVYDWSMLHNNWYFVVVYSVIYWLELINKKKYLSFYLWISFFAAVHICGPFSIVFTIINWFCWPHANFFAWILIDFNYLWILCR